MQRLAIHLMRLGVMLKMAIVMLSIQYFMADMTANAGGCCDTPNSPPSHNCPCDEDSGDDDGDDDGDCNSGESNSGQSGDAADDCENNNNDDDDGCS